MTKIVANPVAEEELQLLNTAADFSGDFLNLDQTTPQTTVGELNFPSFKGLGIDWNVTDPVVDSFTVTRLSGPMPSGSDRAIDFFVLSYVNTPMGRIFSQGFYGISFLDEEPVGNDFKVKVDWLPPEDGLADGYQVFIADPIRGLSGIESLYVTSPTLTYDGTNAVEAGTYYQTALSTSFDLTNGRIAGDVAINGFITAGFQPGGTISIGGGAGSGSWQGTNSIFIGNVAGSSSPYNSGSICIGDSAGSVGTNISGIVAIGSQALQNADNSGNSVAIGNNAGYNSSDASNSLFFGSQAGSFANFAAGSTFLGVQCGYLATNAYTSLFIGTQAGYDATNACNSIFIGNTAGFRDTVNNTSSSEHQSILIGSKTLTDGYKDTILIGHGAKSSVANQLNIGNAFYIKGIYSSETPSSTPVTTAVATMPFGIIGKITTVTNTYNVLESDATVICNKATAFTVTLPTAVVGQIFSIKNIGVGVVTVDGAGSDTIDSALTQEVTQWDCLRLQCNAANSWIII